MPGWHNGLVISQDGKSLEDSAQRVESKDLSHSEAHPGARGQRPRACQSSKKTVFTYEVDFSRHDVARSIRKETFRLRPWEYLTAAANGKLPLEIQAAFQATRPVLESLRQTRMAITRSMSKGSKTWQTMLARLKAYEHSLYTPSKRTLFDSIIIRYTRYCLSEIHNVHRRLRIFLGALPSKIEGWEQSSQPVRPSEIFSWASEYNFDLRS